MIIGEAHRGLSSSRYLFAIFDSSAMKAPMTSSTQLTRDSTGKSSKYPSSVSVDTIPATRTVGLRRGCSSIKS